VEVFGPQVPDRDEAWATYRRALGLQAPPALGDAVRLTPEGLPVLEGVVDWLSRDFLGVRTDDGIYRFMHISVFGGPTGVGHHVFDGVDQAEAERVGILAHGSSQPTNRRDADMEHVTSGRD
jgi:hypothetical protein